MTGLVQVVSMVGVAVLATFVVLTREPANQAVQLAFYGLALGVLFLVLQAPDVALSELVVGPLYTLMIFLTLAKARRREE
jgi:uncharacterized MnhB-related membrane protein